MSIERKSTMRNLRAWIAAVAVSVVALGASAASAEALPASFWGVVPQATPTLEQFQRLKRGGVDSIRTPIGWNAVQPESHGAFNWSGIDDVVKGATTAGIEVLPFLSGAPSWAVAHDPRFGSPVTLPVKTGAQRSGWTNFVKQAVRRYGPNGSFWAENPGVPKRPIRTWQIWNEENFKYFVARPNPADYGKLVNLSYAAIKGSDPAAQIVLGGMFATPIEATFKKRPPQAYFAADFLNRMYKSTPGIKSKFNAVALHPYTGHWQNLTEKIEEVRTALRENGDAGKKLWLTELGWSSGPPQSDGSNSFAQGPAGQARQLKGAFKLLERNQQKWKLQRVYWFSVDDDPGACNFCDGSGLFAKGFIPKRSWFAYVKFAGGTP
ncbi:MAG TPA: glycosyl hydrolase [Solirubrobacterales bacterium]|nr:glycosyl hydrolase [Solirubrobacterales bacterium]